MSDIGNMTLKPRQDPYLIWSNEHAGWWGPGGWGYSVGLAGAGQFSRENALDICRKAIPTASHIDRISEIPVRLADVEEFLQGQMVPQAIMTGEPR